MGLGVDGLKYALVLQDDISSYRWFCPTAAPEANSAAGELARWIRVISSMEWCVSDQGTHFKCRVMELLAEQHKIRHKFSVAHSRWVNDTVENAICHLRAASTSLLSYYRLRPKDWPLVIDVVMRALNEAPLRLLGTRRDGTYRSPLEVMTGIRPRRAEFTFSVPDPDDVKSVSIERAHMEQLVNIEELQVALDNMHRDVEKRVFYNRKKHTKEHNRRTNIVLLDFKLGDFVMVRTIGKAGHKMRFRCTGPRRVV